MEHGSLRAMMVDVQKINYMSGQIDGIYEKYCCIRQSWLDYEVDV